MRDNKPLVSIVCVSFNQEEFVYDCLESIRAQSYSNIELIIADDCSIDATFRIICDWCKEYGHYFSTIKIDSNWYEFNDSFVRKIPKLDLSNKSVFALFYTKSL